MTQEAKLVEGPGGLEPEGDGWFVVNVRDAAWFENEALGKSTLWLSADRAPQLGVNLGVLEPGKPNCLYHAESEQEAFLVLAGECLLIVEGEERRLKAWDFFHCPPWTRHVFVGTGSEPCVILFIGARRPEAEVVYAVDPVAARHGASVEHETRSPREAYANFPEYKPVRMDHAGLLWDAARASANARP